MKNLLFSLIMITGITTSSAQYSTNYDEAKVPVYQLPDPLVFNNGNMVKDKNDWSKRRNEIYTFFEQEIYGISPGWNGKLTASEISRNESVLGGIATRKEIMINLKNGNKELNMLLLMYLPHSNKKAPIFLGYNFNGNHTVTNEKDITISTSWVPNDAKNGITENKSGEAARGTSVSRWPLKEILSRGYGLATIYYGDVDPDFDDGFKNGVHALYDQKRDSASWGSVAAWAWGLSRAMDYLETDPTVDAKKVSIIGHSRLGKAALWAGASDKRFAMIVSNDSGCGGAAISRRKFGETVGAINKAFPHWFCNNFKKYNYKEEILPVDQHELIALMAPRPVYVASASEDLWADPYGEFLCAKNAEPVYGLFGLAGLSVNKMPAAEHPVGNFIGYHLRTGKHDITEYDWLQYLNFADRHLK